MKVKIIKLNHAKDLEIPSYATSQSAGMDLRAAIEEPLSIMPGEFKIVNVGIAIALPQGLEAQIRPRSGLAAKHGVTVLNSPGTIDSDYRGEIKVLLINHGKEEFIIERSMRIAQLIIARHEKIIWDEAGYLDDTKRGEYGFGSTGHA